MHYIGCSELIERKNIDKHLENSLQSHFLIAEERIKNLEIDVKNLQTKLKNYEQVDNNHSFGIGDYIKYNYHNEWIICIITNVENDSLTLEMENGDVINEIPRNSENIRLLM